MNTNGKVYWDTAPGTHVNTTLVKVATMDVLRQHWAWVEKRLVWLKKKDPGTERWEPGHVREQIIRGFSGQSLTELYFAVGEDNAIEGFIVTTVHADPYVQLPDCLVIWIIWANDDLVKRFTPEVKEIARKRFLPKIAFVSGRKGFMLKALRKGFKVKSMVYELEVN